MGDSPRDGPGEEVFEAVEGAAAPHWRGWGGGAAVCQPVNNPSYLLPADKIELTDDIPSEVRTELRLVDSWLEEEKKRKAKRSITSSFRKLFFNSARRQSLTDSNRLKTPTTPTEKKKFDLGSRPDTPDNSTGQDLDNSNNNNNYTNTATTTLGSSSSFQCKPPAHPNKALASGPPPPAAAALGFGHSPLTSSRSTGSRVPGLSGRVPGRFRTKSSSSQVEQVFPESAPGLEPPHVLLHHTCAGFLPADIPHVVVVYSSVCSTSRQWLEYLRKVFTLSSGRSVKGVPVEDLSQGLGLRTGSRNCEEVIYHARAQVVIVSPDLLDWVTRWNICLGRLLNPKLVLGLMLGVSPPDITARHLTQLRHFVEWTTVDLKTDQEDADITFSISRNVSAILNLSGGEAMPGQLRPGEARQGNLRSGETRQGHLRPGETRQGHLRQGGPQELGFKIFPRKINHGQNKLLFILNLAPDCVESVEVTVEFGQKHLVIEEFKMVKEDIIQIEAPEILLQSTHIASVGLKINGSINLGVAKLKLESSLTVLENAWRSERDPVRVLGESFGIRFNSIQDLDRHLAKHLLKKNHFADFDSVTQELKSTQSAEDSRQTLLHWAAGNGLAQVAEALLQLGWSAVAAVPDLNGLTPPELAERAGFTSLGKLLRGVVEEGHEYEYPSIEATLDHQQNKFENDGYLIPNNAPQSPPSPTRLQPPPTTPATPSPGVGAGFNPATPSPFAATPTQELQPIPEKQKDSARNRNRLLSADSIQVYDVPRRIDSMYEIPPAPVPIRPRTVSEPRDTGPAARGSVGYIRMSPVPVISPATGPVMPPATGPVISPATGPVISPATGPVISPATGPVISPATGPVISPATGPVMPPATIPVISPATGPVISPATGPVMSPATGPVISPATGSNIPAVATPSLSPGPSSQQLSPRNSSNSPRNSSNSPRNSSNSPRNSSNSTSAPFPIQKCSSFSAFDRSPAEPVELSRERKHESRKELLEKYCASPTAAISIPNSTMERPHTAPPPYTFSPISSLGDTAALLATTPPPPLPLLEVDSDSLLFWEGGQSSSSGWESEKNTPEPETGRNRGGSYSSGELSCQSQGRRYSPGVGQETEVLYSDQGHSSNMEFNSGTGDRRKEGSAVESEILDRFSQEVTIHSNGWVCLPVKGDTEAEVEGLTQAEPGIDTIRDSSQSKGRIQRIINRLSPGNLTSPKSRSKRSTPRDRNKSGSESSHTTADSTSLREGSDVSLTEAEYTFLRNLGTRSPHRPASNSQEKKATPLPPKLKKANTFPYSSVPGVYDIPRQLSSKKSLPPQELRREPRDNYDIKGGDECKTDTTQYKNRFEFVNAFRDNCQEDIQRGSKTGRRDYGPEAEAGLEAEAGPEVAAKCGTGGKYPGDSWVSASGANGGGMARTSGNRLVLGSRDGSWSSGHGEGDRGQGGGGGPCSYLEQLGGVTALNNLSLLQPVQGTKELESFNKGEAGGARLATGVQEEASRVHGEATGVHEDTGNKLHVRRDIFSSRLKNHNQGAYVNVKIIPVIPETKTSHQILNH